MRKSIWIYLLIMSTPNNLIAQTESLTDIDGNTYKTVHLGPRTWMAENLKTTKFNDGTVIPYITEMKKHWMTSKTPAYCYYRYDKSYRNIYGALYNLWAVNTNKLCPAGWHIPSLGDWYFLIASIPEKGKAPPLKSTTGWYNWKNGTNTSGFTGLPGGYWNNNGLFGSEGIRGFWWYTRSDTLQKPFGAGYFMLHYRHNRLTYAYDYWSNFGYSVRCVKD